jgi:hypothetical protein
MAKYLPEMKKLMEKRLSCACDYLVAIPACRSNMYALPPRAKSGSVASSGKLTRSSFFVVALSFAA